VVLGIVREMQQLCGSGDHLTHCIAHAGVHALRLGFDKRRIVFCPTF
jgi:hypothetical protein